MDKDSKDFLLGQACNRLRIAIQANTGNRRNLTIAKKSATMYTIKRGNR
jgi:hypothetical protein